MATERVLNMDEMMKRFEFLGRDLPRAVYVAMLVSAKAMLAGVTRKLRGEYLNVDTSRGWKSMQDFASFSDEKMQAGIDSDVIYIRAHEEGFHETVQVRAHTRRNIAPVFNNAGRMTRKSVLAFRAALKKRAVRTSFVRAHAMHMNIRASHFMRDTINEQFNPTQDRIQRALVIAATTGQIPTPNQLGL